MATGTQDFIQQVNQKTGTGPQEPGQGQGRADSRGGNMTAEDQSPQPPGFAMDKWLREARKEEPFNNISEATLVSSTDRPSLTQNTSCGKSSLGYLDIVDN